MLAVSNDVVNKIIKIVQDGGGAIYEEEGYINLFGVRSPVTDNTFNDTLYIFWKEGGQYKCVKTTGFLTKPGESSVHGAIPKPNPKGVAILRKGWHKDIWHHGLHQGKYKALRQCKDVTVYRDKTQYGQKGPSYKLNLFTETLDTGYFGINFHKTGDEYGKSANGWSAGCQTFKYLSEFNEAMQMANVATSKGQKTFNYYLANLEEFEAGGVIEEVCTPYDFSQSAQFGGQVNGGSQYSNNVSGLGGAGTGGLSAGVSAGIVSTTSIGTKTIFGQVFPDDDNNRYIDMKSDDIAIIQYSEPNLKVDELNISGKSYATMGVQPDKISYYTPVVYMNDFLIPQTNITNFYLDYSSFVPQVMVEFVDMTNEMLSTNVPKPGSYIKVYIGGYGDENYYKPIRQDFVITNINKTNKTGGEYQNSGNPIKYRITGILNVPLGFRKMTWSSSKINARQAMFNISSTVGLGFATNFNTNNNIDVMRWVNTQNKSYYDFMKEIAQHSCYSPYTFFTAFIDQYYVLNYVECRRLLSHGGDKTDNPQMIYNGIIPNTDKENTEKPNEELNRGDQKVSYYFLTNSEEFKGWTNYIEEYYELNDGYSMVSDGYSKTLTYSDKCGFFNLMTKTYKFLLMPIDNMKRDSNRNLISLPEKVAYDTYIPLNLRQTTNSAYIDNQNLYDNPTAAESTVDLGEVDTSNNFPLYFYASVQNDFQMKNFKKCGLSVRLQNYNPAITRFSRIWLDIYDMQYNSSTQLQKNDEIDKMPASKAKDYLKEKNDNILTFKEDDAKNGENQIYNRSLSGWYVVTDMKISYNTVKDFKGVAYKRLQTQLILNRIEYKPSFNTEYELARKAIEKYKGDNLSENIMHSADAM